MEDYNNVHMGGRKLDSGRSGETEEEEKVRRSKGNAAHIQIMAFIPPGGQSVPLLSNHFLKSPTCQPYTGDPVLTHELCSTYSNYSKCEYVLKCGYECSHE